MGRISVELCLLLISDFVGSVLLWQVVIYLEIFEFLKNIPTMWFRRNFFSCALVPVSFGSSICILLCLFEVDYSLYLPSFQPARLL